MNKKILISLSLIGVVATIAIGGTIAYYHDTETSTGNTFIAGRIDLKIDNECSLNGEPVQDCTWELKDLDENNIFFNFTDLKPGDWGEDTLSLHVDNNDAWACVTFKNLESKDNSCTEPEGKDENATGNNDCDATGELAENLQFFFWADICGNPRYPDAEPGDNIFQPMCDYELLNGMDAYASDIGTGPTTYTLADSQENNIGGLAGESLAGGTTYHIGKVWCFGSLDDEMVDSYGFVWNCDGEQVDNKSQTDSLSGDIEFYAVQSRNNEEFTCSELYE